MTSDFLGAAGKASEWVSAETKLIYADYIADFIEAFTTKYFIAQSISSSDFYSLIKVLQSWRAKLGTSSSQGLLELNDDQLIQKVLNHLLGLHQLPEMIRRNKSIMLSYDGDDESINLVESPTYRFNLLPSDESQNEIIPLPDFLISSSFSLQKIKPWWIKTISSSRQKAKHILEYHGCLARHLILAQPESERKSFEESLLKYIFDRIGQYIFLQKNTELDIFTISYHVFREIPFLVDVDLLYITLSRRLPCAKINAHFLLIPSEENHSIITITRLVPNYQLPSRLENCGWDNFKPLPKTSKRKSKRKSDDPFESLHRQLGGFAISKRKFHK